MHYFFDGHEHDLKRVQTDRFYYRAVRNLIAYSLQSVDRLISDVTYWAKDWSELVTDLPADLPKLSILGAQNRNFRAKDLEDWCLENGWQNAIIKDEGQLLLFSQPELLLSLIVARTPS